MTVTGEKIDIAKLTRRVAVTPLVIEQLAYTAKLNKPSPDWKTSEWDRVVDLVAEAMKAK